MIELIGVGVAGQLVGEEDLSVVVPTMIIVVPRLPDLEGEATASLLEIEGQGSVAAGDEREGISGVFKSMSHINLLCAKRLDA